MRHITIFLYIKAGIEENNPVIITLLPLNDSNLPIVIDLDFLMIFFSYWIEPTNLPNFEKDYN